MKNNLSLIYNLCLVVGDFLVLAAAFIVAYLLRVKFDVGLNPNEIGPSNGREFLGVFLAVIPFWIIIFALLGLYNSGIYEKRFKEFGRLLVGSFIGTLIAIFWHFMSGDDVFPARLVPIYGFAFAFAFLLVFRTLARFVRIQLFSFDLGLTKVLLVGNAHMTTELVDWLGDSKRSGYKIIGVVGQKRTIRGRDVPTYPSFAQFLKENKTDLHGIIQTELYADETKNAEILTYAQQHHVSYRFVPANSGLFVGNLEVELFRSSLPVVTVHQTALFGWGRIVKRMTDLLFGVTLLILTLPFMLLIAIAMKLTSRDPILFKQARLTRFSNVFNVYKFRSQYAKYDNTTPEEAFAMMGRSELSKQYRDNGDYLPNDPRVTPVGRFLRATSLDELPQLINIVKGDISLVGPRALIPQELQAYQKKHTILSVKSGLTGLAQVSGRRDIDFEERRTLDLYYVQNWSLWLDLVILAKTVRAVFGRNGAK
jgi:exopolysaccharide biosynthesis polyprenyl glycosylphosphotransferase